MDDYCPDKVRSYIKGLTTDGKVVVNYGWLVSLLTDYEETVKENESLREDVAHRDKRIRILKYRIEKLEIE